MPRTAAAEAGGQNVCAFLDMLAWSELGAGLMTPATDDGYRVLVGATPAKPLLFASYATHPNILNRQANSTAAGRYQFLYRYWPHYRDLLKLPDFGPLSQDRWAIQLIREQKALDDVIAGRIESAIAKCRNIWASAPGAGYGQHEHSLSDELSAYLKAGGKLA